MDKEKSKHGHPKKVVRLLALNLSERDLSIGLVGLRQYANLDETVRSEFDIKLYQWQKNYDNKGAPGTIDGLDLEAIVDELDPENTYLFGFSTYIWNMAFMLAVARRIKERNPAAITLFGGSQAGGYGARMLTDYDFVDFMISGEAELSFQNFLLGSLDGDYSAVANLYYRHNGQVKCNIPADPRLAKKQSYLPSIEELPYPFRDEEYRTYLDNLDHQVTAQFETERGCPLSCAFCSWGTTLPVRRRHQEDVEEGLTYLLNHKNVKAVYIVDANPFIKNEKGLWLTEFLLHKNNSGKPVYFELNPEFIKDPRVIDNLAQLAGDEMAFGLQSTSDLTLKTIKRRFNRDVYERNVKKLRQKNPDANIKVSLIVGLPGDNAHSFLQSLSFVIGLAPSDIYVHDLLVLPGSEMYQNPEAFGLTVDQNPPHHMLTNETFGREEYNLAKLVGYYAKLLHKYKWFRDEMLNLEACTALSHVELYEQFALLMQEAGLDGLAGQTVAQVSTEEFEYWTDSFVQNKDNETRLRALFNSFERRMKRNQRMLDRTDQRGLEKVA